jgi:arginine/lysine/ornithine decarboxylase
MLYELLSEYNKKGVTPMHMPGHKRNAAMLGSGLPYGIDITEIDGFDNLHDTRGILKELALQAAKLYGSKSAFPLVNGATGGILAAVRSACRPGDTVLMARNCHQSAYNAVLINRLKPVYLQPEIDAATGICGSIAPEHAARAIEKHRDATLVVVTSPTYEGVVSDIGSICDAAHRFSIPVLVDAAHGAHLGFSKSFPPDPVRSGADIAVVSLHKTLPALTQCALALFNSDLFDETQLRAALSIFQTSSPSYVLLSSIDACVRILQEEKESLFDAYVRNLAALDAAASGLKHLKILCHGSDTPDRHPAFFGFDPGKLVVRTRGTDLSGPALMSLLRSEHRIELEMACADYAVALTSICDEAESFRRLADALLDIDGKVRARPYDGGGSADSRLPFQALPPYEAAALEGVSVSPDAAEGMMSLEYVWAYPPGIPLVVPGEIIGTEMIAEMRRLAGAGIALKSTKGALPESIYCTKP